MIEGTVEGRRFSLDFSGDRLKADFEDQEDKEFFLGFRSYCYHPEKGPGDYALKESMVAAQACIDEMIGSGINIVVIQGLSEKYSDIKFE